MSRPFVLFLAFLLALAACGVTSGDQEPEPDYSQCQDGPSRINVTHSSLDASGASSIDLRKGIETDIGLQALDAEGDPCDPSEIELVFEDDAWIEVVARGHKTVLKSGADWFDLEREPRTVLHASLEGLHASWSVNGVIDLDGTWNVTVSEQKLYPDGYLFRDVLLTQAGRSVKWSNCLIIQACEEALRIADNKLSIAVKGVDLAFQGAIAPDRGFMSGIWATEKYIGGWSAERQMPTPR